MIFSGVSVQAIFLVAACLTLINQLLLHYFDDSELIMPSKSKDELAADAAGHRSLKYKEVEM